MQMYQQKEDITLNKYALSKDEFAEMLETYQTDEFVGKFREDIKIMMELAAEGKYPDITVPQEVIPILLRQRQ